MQDRGLNRDVVDKFYTNETVVESCIETFFEVVKPNKHDIVIEPSAGAGAFSNILTDIFKYLVAIDIKPDHKSIEIQDFLVFDIEIIKKRFHQNTNKLIHVIGNPPFGRQSSLAKKFIKKSCTFADSISFILPKSFKKDSFQSVFSDNFHLEKCIDLPENCFLVNNTPYNVPCVFQIWVKKIQPRVKTEIKVPVVIRYVNKNEHPDLSFRRVGVNAGDISKEIETKSSQSHYFLKILNSISVDDFINIYNTNKNFIFNNTVGPKSISKSELNSYINSIEEKLVR